MGFDKYITFEELFSIPLRNGVSKPKKVRGAGYPMVNMGELFSYDRIHDMKMDLVPLTENEKSTALLQHNDLLFARQSLVLSGAGKCSIFLGHNPLTTFESHLIRVRLNNELVSPLFYYYYFKSYEGRRRIESIVEQVAAAGIRGSDLKKIKVPFPEKSLQERIAFIFNKIDEKIEINQNIISNLEMLSQTLFKRWFVDFEFPNEYGEPYKSSGGEMTESELGLIPKGWEIGKFDDLFEVINGFSFKSSNYVEEGKYKIVTIKNVEDGVLNTNSFNKIKELPAKIKVEQKINESDILMSLTGNVGRVCLAFGKNLLLNQRVAKIVSKKEVQYGFVYTMLRNSNNKGRIIQIAKGSAQQNLSTVELKKLKTILPLNCPEELFLLFNDCSSKIIELYNENEILENLLNGLLPKLLSGEIELTDEAEVTEHVSIP